MSGLLTLEVATPERMLLKEQVKDVTVPGLDGELGILPEHAALLSELGSGPLVYELQNGQKKYISICGGYVEVLPDHVRVLAAQAENASEIDAKRAEVALQRANERLLHPTADLDVARALNAMKRAQARLAVAKQAAGK
ncbi:F0F1 ATP synthase subunit epsilon [uncultured Paludibaculum sp.]|uniref:F0F1 ATP synthase subunit epsilon n=1 Tax=uncultured Paludibaculum sp. TaxID=1765020 RepID=UPI002AABAE56|nr:F0F1 ATP synthase subunit epsilon [uncultured Paludibaculum sp.]